MLSQQKILKTFFFETVKILRFIKKISRLNSLNALMV